MDRPPAPPTADSAQPPPAASDWESDLADLAAVPITGVDSLAPLPPTARVLQEVLRFRSGIRSGGGQPRAE